MNEKPVLVHIPLDLHKDLKKHRGGIKLLVTRLLEHYQEFGEEVFKTEDYIILRDYLKRIK